jgi:hypothetical protein
MAVYITEFPAQKGFADAEMVKLTGRFGITVMIIVSEMAGFPVTQDALEVRIQKTLSLFTGEKE